MSRKINDEQAIALVSYARQVASTSEYGLTGKDLQEYFDNGGYFYRKEDHDITVSDDAYPTRAGAILTDAEGVNLSEGCNGYTVDDKGCIVSREDDTKIPYRIETLNALGKSRTATYPRHKHAEHDAIDNLASDSSSPAAAFITHQPCSDCSQKLVKAGVKEVYFYKGTQQHMNTKYAAENVKAEKILHEAGVKMYVVDTENQTVEEVPLRCEEAECDTEYLEVAASDIIKNGDPVKLAAELMRDYSCR